MALTAEVRSSAVAMASGVAVLLLAGSVAYAVDFAGGTATAVLAAERSHFRDTSPVGSATLHLTGDAIASRNVSTVAPAVLPLTGGGFIVVSLHDHQTAADLALTGSVADWDSVDGLNNIATIVLTAEANLIAMTSQAAGDAVLSLTLEGVPRARHPHDNVNVTATIGLSGDAISCSSDFLPDPLDIGISAYLSYDDTDAVNGWHCRVAFGGDAYLHLTAASASKASTAEGVDADTEADLLGYRRGIARLAYVLDVRDVSQVADVPTGGAFLVSSGFISLPGDVLAESGANPGYIGFRRGTVSQAVYAFRAPYPNEVVWFVGDDTLHRWERVKDSANWRWAPYLSMPERFISGVQAFDAFDPDGVYTYVARIVGAVGAQMQQDNRVITNIRDPSKVPERLIPEAAKSLDATLDASADYTKQRATLSLIVPIAKVRGLSEAVNQRLRTLGYRGWVAEVWRRIAWASFSVSPATLLSSSRPDAIVAVPAPNGSFVGYCWRDLAPGVDIASTQMQQSAILDEATVLATDTVAYPGSNNAIDAAIIDMAAAQVALALGDLATASARLDAAAAHCDAAVTAAAGAISADTGIPDRLAYLSQQQIQVAASVHNNADLDITVVTNVSRKVFRISPLTLPAGYIAIAGGTTSALVVANLVAAINTAFGSGSAEVIAHSADWPDFIEYPHGYQIDEPGAYWVSNQLNIHVNHADGSRVDLTKEERKAISTDLLTSILPIHARVRNIATDVDAGEPDAVHVGTSFDIIESTRTSNVALTPAEVTAGTDGAHVVYHSVA